MRALRKGWIQTTEQRKVTREEPPAYLLWADDGAPSDKIANGQQPIHLLAEMAMIVLLWPLTHAYAPSALLQHYK